MTIPPETSHDGPRPDACCRRRRGAFTLLELLAASALSAVLMVVLLQVIGTLARGRVVLERDAAADEAPWQADLAENLRWDLLNATEVEAGPNRLVLTGHGSLDRATLSAGHEPVTVVYALRRLGSRTWLVRRQSPRGMAGGGRGWTELVCPDVTGFVVESMDAGPPLPAVIRSRRRRPELSASTGTVRVRVEGLAGPLVDRVIVLR